MNQTREQTKARKGGKNITRLKINCGVTLEPEKIAATIIPKVESTKKLPGWSTRIPIATARWPTKASSKGRPTNEVLPRPAVKISAPILAWLHFYFLPIRLKDKKEKTKVSQAIEIGNHQRPWKFIVVNKFGTWDKMSAGKER